MLKMQTDMIEICEQQKHHADVMEFINNNYTKRGGVDTLQPSQEQPISPSKGVQAELEAEDSVSEFHRARGVFGYTTERLVAKMRNQGPY